MRYLFTLIIALAGVGVAVQAAANSRMGKALEAPTSAALLSFMVGGIALVAITFSGIVDRGTIAGLGRAPWWAWIGGFFGALYVTLTVIAVPRIGAALTFAAIICGQLIGSLLIDSFGWLGVSRQPITPGRIIGVILLIAGVILIQKM